MNVLKSIFARIWCVWGMIWFIVTMLFFLPFAFCIYLIPEPRRSHIFIASTRIWMLFFLPGIGCPVRIRGKANFAPGQTYIVVCNHNNFMDVPISSPGIPGGNKTIAKIEMARIPLFGFWYRMGSVLVDRKNDQSRRESYAKMKSVLNNGLHMCIYPEGSRNKSSESLKPFQDGAFRLAMETQKAIIPAVILHTRKAIPPNKNLYLWPHRLGMDFLPPIHPSQFKTMQELKEAVFVQMKNHYETNS